MFKNTCQSCFNDIEFPLLGEYSDGEIILQTEDGKGFYIGELIGNPTVDFILRALNNEAETSSTDVFSQKVLTLVADKANGMKFVLDYPICPICRKRQTYVTDNARTTKRELNFATWADFESLEDEEKIKRIKAAVQHAK